MKKNIVIIILVVMVLILGGYFVFDNFLSNEEPVNKENIIQKNTEEEINEEEYEIGSLGTATTEIDACATNFKIEPNNYITIFDQQINNRKLNVEQINEKVIGLKLSTNCGCEVELAAVTEKGNVYVALNYNIYYDSSVKFTKLNIDKKIVGLDVVQFNEKTSTCFENKIVIITSDGNKYILDTDRTHEDSIKLEDYESYQKRVEG